MVTGGWITQADRARWQQQAAAELAAILARHPDMPVIAWTVTASGGACHPPAVWDQVEGFSAMSMGPPGRQ